MSDADKFAELVRALNGWLQGEGHDLEVSTILDQVTETIGDDWSEPARSAVARWIRLYQRELIVHPEVLRFIDLVHRFRTEVEELDLWGVEIQPLVTELQTKLKELYARADLLSRHARRLEESRSTPGPRRKSFYTLTTPMETGILKPEGGSVLHVPTRWRQGCPTDVTSAGTLLAGAIYTTLLDDARAPSTFDRPRDALDGAAAWRQSAEATAAVLDEADILRDFTAEQIADCRNRLLKTDRGQKLLACLAVRLRPISACQLACLRDLMERAKPLTSAQHSWIQSVWNLQQEIPEPPPPQ